MRACSPNLSIIESPMDELNDAQICETNDEYVASENNCTTGKNKFLSFNNMLVNLVEKNNNVLSSLIDTGSSISLIKADAFNRLNSENYYEKKMASSLAKPIQGNLIALKYKVMLEFKLNERVVKHYFFLFDNLDEAFPGDLLLGCDILKKLDFKCNLSESTPVEFLGIKFDLTSVKDNKISSKRSRKNKKKGSFGVSTPMPVGKDELECFSKARENLKNESESLEACCMHLRARGQQIIPANSIKNVACFLGDRRKVCLDKHEKTFEKFSNVNKTLDNRNLVSSASDKDQFNNSIISRSRTIGGRVKLPNCLFEVSEIESENVFYMPIANCGNENYVLKNRELLAEAECLEYDNLTPRLDQAPDVFPSSFEEQLKEINLDHLNESERKTVLNLLKENKEAFACRENPIGCIVDQKINIPTKKDVEFVFRPQYRLPQAYREPLCKITDELLEQGVIKPSFSVWNSPVLLTKKPNGNFRFVLDCRAVNKETITLTHPLPRIDETIESLKGKKYFTSLDARSGFHQLPIDEADQPKTAFTTPQGRFQFTKLPFGMLNASFQFQRAIEQVLKDALKEIARVYIDDIIVHSENFKQHIKDLDKVLKLLIKGGVRLSVEKCKIAKNEIKYLGYIVNGSHIRPSKEKLKAIKEFPAPKCQKDIKRFLGLCGFYRQCIEGFSRITVPLSELLKKDKIWVWGAEEQSAFEILKEALCKEPILRHPDFTKPFEVHCDSSDRAIGASLMQLDGDISYPVSYFSRKISGSELNYSVTEKEALALIESIKHWHYFLAERQFTIFTDHKPLEGCFTKSNNFQGRLARWAVYMQMYNFTIIYKKGELNKLPDLLSRPPIEQNATSIRVLTSVNESGRTLNENRTKENEKDLFSETNIIRMQENDPFCVAIRDNIINNKICKIPLKTSLSEFYVDEKILYYLPNNCANENEVKSRVVIPFALINEALNVAHCQNTSAHYGFTKTLFNFRNQFYYPNSIKVIKDHVNSCLPCAKRKHANVPKAPLGSFSPVYAAGERIGIDLIGPLTPTDNDNVYILTIVDHFSRFTNLVPLPDKNAITVAKALVDYILRNSCPIEVVSDKGLEMVNEIMVEVCNLLQIDHINTSPYHAQANSMVEVRNREIENILSFLCSERPELWDTYTQYVSAALNSSINTATKYTPFYLFHGREYYMHYGSVFSKLRPIYTDEKKFADEVKIRMQRAYNAVNDYCQKYKSQYHKQYNKKAKARNFRVNKLIMLKNNARKGKLSQRWLGPFRIIKVIENKNNLIIKQTFGQFKEKAVHMDRCKLYNPKVDNFPKFDTIPDVDQEDNSEISVACPYNLRSRK